MYGCKCLIWCDVAMKKMLLERSWPISETTMFMNLKFLWLFEPKNSVCYCLNQFYPKFFCNLLEMLLLSVPLFASDSCSVGPHNYPQSAPVCCGGELQRPHLHPKWWLHKRHSDSLLPPRQQQVLRNTRITSCRSRRTRRRSQDNKRHSDLWVSVWNGDVL